MGESLSHVKLISDYIVKNTVEEVIEGNPPTAKRRKVVSPGACNRELATLRRALRRAYEWKRLDRVPRIRLLPGERVREFVLRYAQEALYLEFAPQPLSDAAMLILDTGLRVGEALALEWVDVHFEAVPGAPLGQKRQLPATVSATVEEGKVDVVPQVV